MKIIEWRDFFASGGFGSEHVAMTLGVFDGVHRGHQKLIRELQAEARHFPVIFTFRENPAKLIPSKKFAGDILTFAQKLEYLEQCGVCGAVIIDFSHDFSKLTGREFFQIIRDKCRLEKLVLGSNHRLGHDGKTGAHDAAEIFKNSGVSVVIPSPVEEDGLLISSTRIRRALAAGELDFAADMLGKKFCLDLRELTAVRESGSFRISTESLRQILPPTGRYAAFCEENQEFIATKLILEDKYIRWNQNSEIPAKTIVLCQAEKEET